MSKIKQTDYIKKYEKKYLKYKTKYTILKNNNNK
jgi:hypothetical protein